jgi:plastocyanin
MRHHRPLATAALAALTLGLAGLAACGDDDDSASDATSAATAAPAGTEATAGTAGGEAPAGGDSVSIANNTFEPGTLEVAAGTEVTWENQDGIPHRIASEDGSFDSEDLNQGDTFSATFDAAGEFPYICGIHPTMTGTIVVA